MTEFKNIAGVPDFELYTLREKSSSYALLIPIINEGQRIKTELQRAKDACIHEMCDIILCDGGSTDGSTDLEGLKELCVSALIVKKGPGKQGAQLRCGIYHALGGGYDGILTVDGNNKDSVESVPLFIEKLREGYDFVQGSRFIKGGRGINTPLSRLLAVKLIHAPIISLTAGQRFTDTTNAFRAHSRRYLEDARVQPLRDIFQGYELLAYLSTRFAKCGYKGCEVPVTREYPATGKTPTKISPIKGNLQLLKVLFSNAIGLYDPK